MRRPTPCIVLVVASILALQGCAKRVPEHLTRVEIYFRDFSATSHEHQTPESLPRAATVKAVVTDPATIARLMASVSKDCPIGASAEPDSMDLYLLVRAFDGNRLRGVRKASKFHLDQWPEGRRCPLTDADRDRIGRDIAALGQG